MKRSTLEILLAGALLALLGQVAALGGATLWAGTRQASAGAGLSIALYAPFGLLALLLPALAAPVARRALARWAPGGASTHPWPGLGRFAALLGIAEALTLAAQLAAGASPLPPVALHGLLAAHGAVAALVLGRGLDHANTPPHANA